MSDETNTKVSEDDEPKSVETSESGPENKSQADIEREQESQLRAKFPAVKGPGASAFLQKRLSKGTKYFDSGDYNMAKAKVAGSSKLLPGPAAKHNLLTPAVEQPIGDTIPTPETVPQRKPSLQQSKLVSTS